MKLRKNKIGNGNLTIEGWDHKSEKMNKGEGKKHFKKKISTNTSPKVPPTPRINLEDHGMDNFCRTHCAYHWDKTCPEFINSFNALLLPSENLGKENKIVEEDNYEDEEEEEEYLKEGEHPPNLNLNLGWNWAG